MTTETPLARYSAVNGALTSGFVTAQLHHPMGHDPNQGLVTPHEARKAFAKAALEARILVDSDVPR
jgi:hypothetical protein